jgi:hypothetical protein
MHQTYFPFTLRLYGHVLRCLRDHNFTGLDLFYRIKDCWKERETPHELLLKPLERGLTYKIGEWCFEMLFDLAGKSESCEESYAAGLGREDLTWFLEDVMQAVKRSGVLADDSSCEKIDALLKEIEVLYENDEAAYWTYIARTGRRKLMDLFSAFVEREHTAIASLKDLYAPGIADRIVHDRELCAFIARTVMDIGFDGETREGLRARWVERETWPTRINEILRARDRGKCSSCGLDIVLELEAKGHIDHIFPLSQGGCNDLVNLQLLCAPCNLKKNGRSTEVMNSVPPYTRRP